MPLSSFFFRRPKTTAFLLLRWVSPFDATCFRPNPQFRPIGDFMTKKQNLHVVKPKTTVDEALESLVTNRISGLSVVDDDWNLVGVVSDYDLLAIDSISGGPQSDATLFPDVHSSWKTFNEIQKLLSKTNGKVVGDLMTPTPLVVHESTSLEEAARLDSLQGETLLRQLCRQNVLESGNRPYRLCRLNSAQCHGTPKVDRG